METYPTRLRKWTRAEYEPLIEIGVFHPGEPVELLGGELMVSRSGIRRPGLAGAMRRWRFLRLGLSPRPAAPAAHIPVSDVLP